MWQASKAGLKVGGALFEAFPPEVIGGHAPDAVGDGGGEVFFDDGVFGEAAAEVSGAEIESVRGVRPKVWESGLPTDEGDPSDGARDRSYQADVVGTSVEIVKALGPGGAEHLARAGFGVAPKEGPVVDSFGGDTDDRVVLRAELRVDE